MAAKTRDAALALNNVTDSDRASHRAQDSALETPKSLGFRMPAEWERHEATWLSWPKDPLTFPPEIIESVENIYCQMIEALQEKEKVKVLVNDEEWEEKVRKRMSERGVSEKNVVFYHIKSVDVWMRDYGPIFVVGKGKKKAAVKWVFNAWGNKYYELIADNEAGEKAVEATGVQVFKPGIILEGGSIDVNGEGTLLTTEQCLLNENRNKNLTRAQIESYLKDFLGVERIVWLKDGVEGDDTDGHVDDIARFVGKNKVVCAFEEKENDANHLVLKENSEILEKEGFEVLKLPMPKRIDIPERRLPVSYANFYAGNGVVLLPVFRDEKDEEAISVLQECFPKRKIIPIYCRDLVYGYGGIHCVTQQEPRM